jgi:hypothetical protein
MAKTSRTCASRSARSRARRRNLGQGNFETNSAGADDAGERAHGGNAARLKWPVLPGEQAAATVPGARAPPRPGLAEMSLLQRAAQPGVHLAAGSGAARVDLSASRCF